MNEAYQTCVDPAIEVLKILHDELPQDPRLKNLIQTVLLELRFFTMFFWGLEKWGEAGNDLHLGSVMKAMETELIQMTEGFETGRGKITDSALICYRFVKKIKQFKPLIRQSCIIYLDGTFKSVPFKNQSYAKETATFITFVQENVKVLNSKVYFIAPVKKQIGFIQEKLNLFGNVVELVSQLMTGHDKLDDFYVHIRTWANHISCLACLYWTDEINENLACTMGTMLSDLMQKTMPYKAELIMLHLRLLKATRYGQLSNKAQIAVKYAEFLLENLDDVEILRERLIFLLSFVVDPIVEDSELIWTQIDAILGEMPDVICSIHLGKKIGGVVETKTQFSGLLEKIDRVEAEVRKLHVVIACSSESSPKTNAIGLLDFLLRNIKKMLQLKVKFISSVKYQIEIIHQELESFRPIIQYVMELQDKHGEIKDLWMQIINLVNNAYYVIKLSSVTDVPVWYCMLCLSNVIEEVKVIKIVVKRIEDGQIYDNKKLVDEMQLSDALPTQATTSRTEGAFIGFKEDTKSIMDHLVGGRKDLTIISISGMPGQGKTTLAKRISSDPSIQYHFHKIVWCYVSKGCKVREVLITILDNVGNVGNVDAGLEIQDLAECVRKSLKGKRYLIVMDDIWDIDVWRQVQGSFPDDNNSSRIMFTSRNENLVSQTKTNSISHPLQLFSDEESWELMKEKLSHCHVCPPEFLKIAKQIATYCKGLPLAVVLIAALLGKTQQNLDLWNQVAENLKTHLAREGCMHIIELSYKYLPDHLKPCFLYFGAFPRGESIRARKLKLLWIAEGFINENGMQSSETLASEYLHNLVCQYLVVVTKRSSVGGIKTCNVHDLLYDLCLQKAVEENFLHPTDESIVVNECYYSPQKYNHHRLCIGTRDSFNHPRPICTRTELPTSQVHSLLWSLGDSWRLTDKYFSLFLKSFKVLTVLDLEEMYVLVLRFPQVILSIIHLRYLALWASIDCIPPSIAQLWNLETLIVRASLKVPLPETLWKMKSLRHVYIDQFHLFLEGFEITKSYMAVFDIETLCAPILYYDHQTREFFKMLPKLRKLHCYCEDFNPTWFSMFESLKKLEVLRIGRIHGDKDLLFPFQKFPTFNFPENLKKLTLSQLKLLWSAMPEIGKLPNLEVLKLLDSACLGTTWDLGEGEFPKLRFLKLCELPIEEIDISSCDHPFPCLEELVVESCSHLQLPSSFGDICTLKIITLHWSYPAACSVWRILKDQQDMGNDSLQVLVKTFPDFDVMMPSMMKEKKWKKSKKRTKKVIKKKKKKEASEVAFG